MKMKGKVIRVDAALDWMSSQLGREEALLLLQRLLGVERVALIAYGERELTASQSRQLAGWVQRAVGGEPLPYITGVAPFYGRLFAVTPEVLIPRPETEQLVELAFNHLLNRQATRLVDVGTGSGIIPVTLACELRALGMRGVEITAVDLSPAALQVARENGQRFGVAGQIHFAESDLLTLAPPEVTYDLITANLPYVADDEWGQVGESVKTFEPDLALRGGPEGLDLIAPLLAQAASRLAPDGVILLEIGWQQGEKVERLAQRHFPSARVTVWQDFAGHNRVVEIQTG